eukprot:TRINITY_DN589_c1_g1_i1.p1 TRINITY_DN589_c1_g1~~TRINITY_DN589_c1_g1_i1.p1  ORF type:complete len:193 (+),score=78.61 TRINITY_DN589_c1_g1_i1:58-579(+)
MAYGAIPLMTLLLMLGKLVSASDKDDLAIQAAAAAEMVAELHMIENAFGAGDVDKSGQLDREEVVRLFSAEKNHDAHSAAAIADMLLQFREFDEDKDDLLSKDEFTELFDARQEDKENKEKQEVDDGEEDDFKLDEDRKAALRRAMDELEEEEEEDDEEDDGEDDEDEEDDDE